MEEHHSASSENQAWEDFHLQYARLHQRDVREYQAVRARNPAQKAVLYPRFQQVNMTYFHEEIPFHGTSRDFMLLIIYQKLVVCNLGKSLHQRCAPQWYSSYHHGKDHVHQLEQLHAGKQRDKTGGLHAAKRRGGKGAAITQRPPEAFRLR